LRDFFNNYSAAEASRVKVSANADAVAHAAAAVEPPVVAFSELAESSDNAPSTPSYNGLETGLHRPVFRCWNRKFYGLDEFLLKLLSRTFRMT
jgi:hypothetical protein